MPNLVTEAYPFGAPASAGAVVKLFMEKRSTLQIKFINNGKNDLTVKIQDSPDGSSYTDVSGISYTIVPGGSVVGSANIDKYFQIVASGNTEGLCTLSVDDTTNIQKI